MELEPSHLGGHIRRQYDEDLEAIRTKVLGPAHPYVAVSMQGLGEVAMRRGERDEAIVIFERAHALLVEALGAEHPDVTETTVRIGDALAEQGDVQGARARYQRAMAIREAAWGAEHAEVVEVRDRLARLAEQDADGAAKSDSAP